MDPSTRGTVMVLLDCLYDSDLFCSLYSQMMLSDLYSSWCVQNIGVFRSAWMLLIGFCSKDCAKRKNLWTTVFAPMAFVQTAIGDHHFLFFAHFLD